MTAEVHLDGELLSTAAAANSLTNILDEDY